MSEAILGSANLYIKCKLRVVYQVVCKCLFIHYGLYWLINGLASDRLPPTIIQMIDWLTLRCTTLRVCHRVIELPPHPLLLDLLHCRLMWVLVLACVHRHSSGVSNIRHFTAFIPRLYAKLLLPLCKASRLSLVPFRIMHCPL